MEVTVATPLLTFCFGLLVGHWLTLWRDRRKEFNEDAAPVRAWLVTAASKVYQCHPLPDEAVIDAFACQLSRWKRSEFLLQWSRYRELYNELQDRNEKSVITDRFWIPSELDDLATLVQRLMPFTKRR